MQSSAVPGLWQNDLGPEPPADGTQGVGAYEVHGSILNKYEGFGGGYGWLGAPTSDETATPGGRGSHFEHGDIYWSAATGAHGVSGGERVRYNRVGGAWSYLGLPIDDGVYQSGDSSSRFSSPPYYRYGFQHGTLAVDL